MKGVACNLVYFTRVEGAAHPVFSPYADILKISDNKRYEPKDIWEKRLPKKRDYAQMVRQN